MDNKHYTCSFSHLILSGRCGCEFSAKDCVAEKEFTTCIEKSSSNDCQTLYKKLRDNSNFALKSHHIHNLSISQQSQIKMGGLLALTEIINQSPADKIDNIAKLIALVKQKYKSFEKIPFSQLMPKIAAFKFRQHKKI